jgi:hypothetical protein
MAMLPRSRWFYLVLVLVVIGLGLASRRFAAALPSVLGKYPGDALWALMVFLLVGCLAPRWPSFRVALIALGLSFAVEFLQLYQAEWITSIRKTTLGHLVLGSHFHAMDLLAYVVGVGVGLLGERVFAWRRWNR